ncbi:MAG TPA: ABC transporter permease [Candidatus Limnocylindrales bacterium]|jgi:ABC-2 type transport system permease protein|nr:ABC transporter permease [Candidatus Limnocylindrales bacterium]
MQALLALTVANIKSYLRDRAALFWTLAFPLIFIFMFGFIFQEGGQSRLTLGWVDEDRSPAVTQLREAFAAQAGTEIVEATQDDALARMRQGEVDAVIVVPAGYGEAIASGAAGTGGPTQVVVYTDPSRSNLVASVYQSVQAVLGVVNLGGRPPLVIPQPETLQTENLNFISYFVPSMLGLSVMQVGIFAAIPLVADREKLILKRLAATPLRRWQLVGSNVLMRLLIALGQAVIIIGVGVFAFGVQIVGSLLLAALFIALGAMAFLALGYVIASFARTEEAANGMTSVVQFPMMFLSGTFFPLDQMPAFLQGIARVIPLTYLSDALRQVMVGGAAFAPLWVCALVLVGWLVVCFAIASRTFRWQ